MKDLFKEFGNTTYPQMLRDLPEIDIPIEGIRGWLLQEKCWNILIVPNGVLCLMEK